MRRYYQDLELGQLDPSGVASSVWDALTGLLGRDARGLGALPPFASAAPAMYREADFESDLVYAGLAVPSMSLDEPAPELDEVDRLFGVTSSG